MFAAIPLIRNWEIILHLKRFISASQHLQCIGTSIIIYFWFSLNPEHSVYLLILWHMALELIAATIRFRGGQ